ncbi:hypothetical protein [Desulfuromonas acetoxidans]|uniref:hypothetical protein n=1 Tax=Desulfuromonas acetoxidans TaxID=891 RepID=UPI0029306DBF|nr:hypothetical protein [Desulfuromonas acetoxidans]
MTNIDIFNEYVALIFSDLLDYHPVPVSFDLSVVARSMISNDMRPGLSSEQIHDLSDQCYYSFDFLARNGFIEIEELDRRLRTASMVRLTLAGYNILSSTPFGEHQKSLAEELRSVLNDAVRDKLRDWVRTALQPSSALVAIQTINNMIPS